MIVELGSFTTAAGNNVISLNGTETPVLIDFWIGPRTGTTEASNLDSFGTVDVGNAIATCQTNFSDSTSSQTKNSAGSSTASSCLQHYARVSGTLTKVLDMKFVSSASGTFTVNVTTSNAAYTVFFKVYG